MLIFERGEKGRGLSLLPECDVPEVLPDDDHLRKNRYPSRRCLRMISAAIIQSLTRNLMVSTTGSIRLAPVP